MGTCKTSPEQEPELKGSNLMGSAFSYSSSGYGPMRYEPPKPESKFKRGYILSYYIINDGSKSGSSQSETREEKFRFRHFGIVVSDDTIISKYEDEDQRDVEKDGILKKESLDMDKWNADDVELVSIREEKCAQHAEKRFNAGEVVENNPNIRRDKFPYKRVSANCQHFIEDCRLQEDGAGGSVDKQNIVGALIAVPLNIALAPITIPIVVVGTIIIIATCKEQKQPPPDYSNKSKYSDGFVEGLKQDLDLASLRSLKYSYKLEQVFEENGTCNFETPSYRSYRLSSTKESFEDFRKLFLWFEKKQVTITFWDKEGKLMLRYVKKPMLPS